MVSHRGQRPEITGTIRVNRTREEPPGGRLPTAEVPHGGHHRVPLRCGADHHALVVEERRGQPILEGGTPSWTIGCGPQASGRRESPRSVRYLGLILYSRVRGQPTACAVVISPGEDGRTRLVSGRRRGTRRRRVDSRPGEFPTGPGSRGPAQVFLVSRIQEDRPGRRRGRRRARRPDRPRPRRDARARQGELAHPGRPGPHPAHLDREGSSEPDQGGHQALPTGRRDGSFRSA